MTRLTCHLCGLELCQEGEGYIALIGETTEQKTARWIDSAGRHMAAMHPQVIAQISYGGAALGYLVLIANVRTDEPVIHERTKIMLEHAGALVDNLRRELSDDAQRELNLSAF